ncbi:MAG: hypothetical protein H6736_00105, partial [Alphaproteobacteria bacterium]|nr:hypothetical protein [Alphaproteobacteria bacterium]
MSFEIVDDGSLGRRRLMAATVAAVTVLVAIEAMTGAFTRLPMGWAVPLGLILGFGNQWSRVRRQPPMRATVRLERTGIRMEGDGWRNTSAWSAITGIRTRRGAVELHGVGGRRLLRLPRGTIVPPYDLAALIADVEARIAAAPPGIAPEPTRLRGPERGAVTIRRDRALE